MLKRLFKGDRRTELEKEISDLLKQMKNCDPSTDEYKMMANALETLCKADSYKKSRSVSWDTILIVSGNLIGIFAILHHEDVNVITSKALGFVLKGRV